MLTATHHHASEVDRYKDTSTRWSVNHTITRHQYTLAEGATIDWWELDTFEGGMVGGEGDTYERTSLFGSEAAARTAFLKARADA